MTKTSSQIMSEIRRLENSIGLRAPGKSDTVRSRTVEQIDDLYDRYWIEIDKERAKRDEKVRRIHATNRMIAQRNLAARLARENETPPSELEEMQSLFNLVCDKDDWRAPIDAWVPELVVDKYVNAIHFFTATTARQVETRFNPRKGDPCTMVRLVSVGYRNGPAGDH